MAWPYSGNWDGLPLSALPDIFAAICNGISQRKKESYFLSQESTQTINWNTFSGTSTTPTASDFVGMINPTQVLGLMYQIVTEIQNLASPATWKTDDTFATSWTLSDIFDDIGLLTESEFEDPQHITQADWYLTAKGVLDRLVYRSGTQRLSVSGTGYREVNFDDARDGTGSAVAISYPEVGELGPGYWMISRDSSSEEWYVYLELEFEFASGILGATNSDYTLFISDTGISPLVGTIYSYSLNPTTPTTHTFTDVIEANTTATITSADANYYADPPFNTILNTGFLLIRLTGDVNSDMTTFLDDQS